MSDNNFLATFLDEAVEILERWEGACLKIESSPSSEVFNELFRSAHNIKGSSKSVGLVKFGNLVHKAEDVITKLKSGDLQANSDVVATLLDCQKCLGDWIEALRADPEYECDTTGIEKALLSLHKEPATVEVPSDGGLVLFDDETTTVKKEAPLAGARDLGTILVESGQATQEQVENALKQQNRKLGEILVDNGVVAPEAVKAALAAQRSNGHKPDETLRVALRKLDSVIRLIGELSIQYSIVKNAKDTGALNEQASIESINLAHKVIQDLQSEAMSLRMQPLEGLFQRMERVCRDVARQLNKPIHVVLKGTDVELDKTVIEQMKDPLVHILRNAVDHGIETSEQRKNTTKPATATIVIEGIQTAANVSIRISDDGRGLNEEKILKKAKENGLVSASVQPTPSEIHQMIFLPGFSTAEKVTDVSGRGVGMDVVKRAVDELSGSIQIESRSGVGTQFLITLPSTLSILDAVVVDLQQGLYSVPVQDVEEVVDLSQAHIETTTQKGRVMNLRGRILPVEKLADYLPKAAGDALTLPRVGSAKGIAIIAKHHSTTVAFEVDRVVGQQSIIVRQLEGKLAQVPGFAGGTILANGEPSMIIHLPQIVKSYISVAKNEGGQVHGKPNPT